MAFRADSLCIAGIDGCVSMNQPLPEIVMSVSLRRIEAFIKAVETGSITEASRLLNMSVPAVSKAIRELERGVGADLLVRSSRGIRKTKAGEIFFGRSKLAMNEIARGCEEIGQINGRTSGRISVGATADTMTYLLPTAIMRQLKRYADMSVEFKGGTLDKLAAEARAGDIDFFLSLFPDGGAPDGLVGQILYKDELVAICRKNHPLLQSRSIDMEKLQDYRFLRLSDSPATDLLLKKSFSLSGIPLPGNWLEIHHLEAMRPILRDTNVIAITTRTRVFDELQSGIFQVLPIRLRRTQHAIGLFQREGRCSTWATQLVRILKRTIRESNMVS